ncbi:MAG TPA: TetR/AcrR family transcriptional regulator [Stellaceae bacterium]|nr:TetR/AcrR family transcriptional regulator [Stellaceae bacterium]
MKQQADGAVTDGRRLRGDKSRATILARAVNVASTDGLSGLTIGALASDVGISKGNISVLFGDKETLQLATIDAGTEVFVAKVVTPALRNANPLDRLRHLTDGWFDYVDSRTFPGGCLLYATVNEFRARPGRIQDRANHHRTAWIRLLTATVRDAQKAGLIRGDVDPEQLVFELTAFQSAANTAALLGDQATFVRARRTSRERITAAAVRGAVRRKRPE